MGIRSIASGVNVMLLIARVGGHVRGPVPFDKPLSACLDIHGARSAATRLHPQLLHDHPRNTTITSTSQVTRTVASYH